jgi:NTE family protein
MFFMFKKRVGLVLGGGGAKGYAHIGVLKFLEEQGICVDYVVGTSIGAVIGAMHCFGYSAVEIEQIAKSTNFKALFDLTLPKIGLIRGDKIEKYLRHIFEDKKFSDLQKPFFAVAVDINNFQEVIFDKGDLTKAVRASVSIPGIFHPVSNKKRILVDGGILNNLPIDVLQNKGVDKIIAVNLEGNKINKEVYETAVAEKSDISIGIVNILLNSYTMIISSQLKEIHRNQNVFVLHPELGKISFKDFHKSDDGINAGYECAKRNSNKLKKFVGKSLFRRVF